MTRSRSWFLLAFAALLTVCAVCTLVGAIWWGAPRLQNMLVSAPPTATQAAAATRPPAPPVSPAPSGPATLPPAVATPPTRAAEPTRGADGPRPAAPVPPTQATSSAPGAAVASATPEPDIAARLARTTPPGRDLYALTERLKKIPGPIPHVVSRVPEPHKVGDKATFWINDQSGKRYYEMVAVLRYITDHVYMWVEDGVNVNDDAIRRSADIFEKRIYPTTHQYFGTEASPGIDGDRRLTILNGRIPDVGGYFSSADTYPTVVNPYSNQHEMFYINIDGYPIGTAGYEGTLAHEFQHMIHANYDRSETSWINEGLSELSARLNGYGGSRFAGAFSANPNTQLTTWTEGNSTGPHYGAAYLFASYSFDRFGADFIRDLVAEKAEGIAGYENTLKKHNIPMTFEQVFQDWVVANYLDDPKLAAGRYGYPDIEVPKPKIADTLEQGSAPREGSVAQYGAEYLRVAGREPLTLDFAGATVNQLIPTTARSGQYYAWSNRGDNMDSNLTREFDLTRIAKATLQFSAWYDIEDGWDYGYIEVSTDGGKTWDLLKTNATQDTNPNGNAFGPGLTGASGGAKGDPQWIEQTVDLTPYAGKNILVRFEMITDDAVNLNSFAIDNVRIPELGYREDFEQGLGGWDAQGWLRTNGLVPQRYLLQVMEMRKDGATVRPITVGADGRATIAFEGLGKDYAEAILVVAGAAPVTTQTAPYKLSVK